MEKSGDKTTDKKLTDHELIAAVIAWYDDRLSPEGLREAVSAYAQPNALDSAAGSQNFEERAVGFSEPVEANRNSSKPNLTDRKFESYEVVPFQQFEPTDEAIGGSGWMIDVWAVYYGVEDFFHRISFGLLTMQTLAVLFCILISAAVMIGAWQNSVSSERQKKATFKSIEIAPVTKDGIQSAAAELQTPPQETNSLVPTDESTEATSHSIAQPIMLNPGAFESEGTELSTALSFMEEAAWDAALAELKILENDSSKDLQPLLSLLKVEALIQKRDTTSMEFARQLLMDCKSGEYELIYELLVTRWMLLGRAEDRQRFLNESASLPDSYCQRMSTWAKVRNGNKDALTEELLETNTSKGQGEVCDLLFLASFHYNVGRTDKTVRTLLEIQHKLRILQASGKSSVENWLLEIARNQLATKVEEILAMVSRKPSNVIN